MLSFAIFMIIFWFLLSFLKIICKVAHLCQVLHFCKISVSALYYKCKAGLKKLFVCSHPTQGLRVGSGGGAFFFFLKKNPDRLVKVSLVSRALPLFDKAWLREEPFSATIVIIDSDKALVHQRSEGTRLK